MEGSQNVVVVLGAGASKAINDAMPLTDELGRIAIDRLGLKRRSPSVERSGYFESWMSRLAEDQPDLDEATNLRNRSLFRELADAVAEIIVEREALALSEPIPTWLVEMCHVWHEQRATLISFNYDTLIERAAARVGLYDWTADRFVSADDVIDRLPAEMPKPGRFGLPPIAATMRLLKLHGSVEWFATPGDTTGATLARRSVSGWQPPEPVDRGSQRREFPGREPFIVPPATAKSGYYRNPVLRQLWQDAGSALAAADEVHLIGYSLPPADLVTRGMLIERPNDGARWTITDIRPAGVQRELKSVGLKSVAEHRTASVYAEAQLESRAQIARQLLQKIVADADSATPIVVSWGESAAFGLSSEPRKDGQLVAEPHEMALGALVNSLTSRDHLQAAELRRVLSGRLGSVRVRVGSELATVVGATMRSGNTASVPRDTVVLHLAMRRPMTDW